MKYKKDDFVTDYSAKAFAEQRKDFYESAIHALNVLYLVGLEVFFILLVYILKSLVGLF